MKMKQIIYFACVLSLISGCAQNSMQKELQSTTKQFEKCSFSVRFTGQPEELLGNLYSEAFEHLGGKPEKPIWKYSSIIQGISKTETAFCICLQEPTLTNKKVEISNTAYGSGNIPGIGLTTESNLIEIDNGIRTIARATIADGSSCMLYQIAGSSGEPNFVREVTRPFLNSLTLLPKAVQDTVIKPQIPTASERLKQIESLYKEKLISEAEFMKRREIILQSL